VIGKETMYSISHQILILSNSLAGRAQGLSGVSVDFQMLLIEELGFLELEQGVLRVTEECKKTHYSTTIIIFHQATLTLNY
jgi:ssDNA-specific exonuclease RecJ